MSKDLAQAVLGSPKVAGVVSAATTTTGLSTVFELIPDDIGKLATVIGIILSAVLIYTHLKKHRVEVRKLELEIASLERRNKPREG